MGLATSSCAPMHSAISAVQPQNTLFETARESRQNYNPVFSTYYTRSEDTVSMDWQPENESQDVIMTSEEGATGCASSSMEIFSVDLEMSDVSTESTVFETDNLDAFEAMDWEPTYCTDEDNDTPMATAY